MRFQWPAVLLWLSAFLLIGCTGTQPVTEQPAVTMATEDKTFLQCEPGREHWRAAGPAKRGGVMVRGANPVTHLDVTAGGSFSAVASQVAQTLVEARQCHYEDDFMVPRLARDWEVSADGMTWTFKLRDDVKWHNKPPVNGRPFTSADVAWLIEQHKGEASRQRPFWINVVSHETPDPRTIVMRLGEPDADFLVQVGFNQNVMVPREVKEQYGDFKTVVLGTGAFMLKEYKHNQEYIVEPNPDYQELGIDGKQLPYLDGVRTIVFADEAAELAALRAGQIDETSHFGVSKLEADALRRDRPHNLRVEEQFNPTVLSLWFNTGRTPLNDVRVRRAIARAMDPDSFVARYHGGALWSGFVPASITAYAWSEQKLKERFPPDREGAKRLLAEVGWRPNEYKLVLKTGRAYTEDAEVAREQLLAVGVQAEIVVDGNAFSPIFFASDFDLAIGPPGGVTFANYWVRSILVGKTAPEHQRQLNDPQTEALSLAQGREMDPAKRKILLDQLQERLYEVLPNKPLVTYFYYRARSCRLVNASLYAPGYNARTPVEAWLDPTGC